MEKDEGVVKAGESGAGGGLLAPDASLSRQPRDSKNKLRTNICSVARRRFLNIWLAGRERFANACSPLWPSLHRVTCKCFLGIGSRRSRLFAPSINTRLERATCDRVCGHICNCTHESFPLEETSVIFFFLTTGGSKAPKSPWLVLF